MGSGLGLFNLAAKSAAANALARHTAAGLKVPAGVFARSEKPAPLGTKDLNSLTIDASSTIRAMFQAAWDKVHKDENFISDDMVKRLEEASKSDNKEIAAERLRQAKAKLRSLRLQAQMAAASGDPKQLKRIAQQAAQAAREVSSAARGLAEGIAAGAVPSDGSASAGNIPAAAAQPQGDGTPTATTPTTGTTPTPTTTPTAMPQSSGLFSDEREALRKLGDEARAAIAQAKGLIAFAAQAARNKRQKNEDDDSQFFRQLQQSVQDASQDLDSALNEAGRTLDTAESGLAGGSDTVSAVTTTALFVQVTTEVTVTANIVI